MLLIFLVRLFSFIESLSNDQKGFIPDIVYLLYRYELLDHLNNWLTNGTFPDRNAWKRIVRNSVSVHYLDARSARIASDSDFSKFRSIFRCTSPASLWTLPAISGEISLCKFIAKLCTYVPSDAAEICALGTVHLIFWGGAWVFFEKNFLALILAKKNNLAQWHCEKNNLSPIVTQNSLIGMFEMSKSKIFSGSLRSPE